MTLAEIDVIILKKQRRINMFLTKLLEADVQNSTELEDVADGVNQITNLSLEAIFSLAGDAVRWVITSGLKVVLALLAIFITFKIINKISKAIEKRGDNVKTDKTLMRTLAYIVKIALKCLIGIVIIGWLGIDTSAITALIASFGVCIGLAVNGAVANIAGGVLLIVTRPFKVDDYIEAQGASGTVQDIHLTNTVIVTPDNKVVYLPNGVLANGNIVNYSVKDMRRVDLTFSIAYENNFEKAKEIIKEICSAHELVIQERGFTIRVSEHAQNSINITTKVWVKRTDYWTVHFDLLEGVKAAFDKEGITIPYNQLDVHVKKD